MAKRVRAHHEANGGMSRLDKLPVYLTWAGLISSRGLVSEYSNKFSALVKQRVIESDWVAGIERFLNEMHTTTACFSL